MPVDTPRYNFDHSSLGLFFGNIKMKQLVKASDAEAKLAKNAKEMTLDKLDTIHALMTFSDRTANTFQEYEHKKALRAFELQAQHCAIQKGHAELKILDLEAKEKEAKIQQLSYQTALIAQEVKLTELEVGFKMKQYKKMEEE
jgi:HSP90 family molecular chaperone